MYLQSFQSGLYNIDNPIAIDAYSGPRPIKVKCIFLWNPMSDTPSSHNKTYQVMRCIVCNYK